MAVSSIATVVYCEGGSARCSVMKMLQVPNDRGLENEYSESK
jgi:hypothetical protein